MGRVEVDRLFERALLGFLVSGFLALASTGELSPITLTLSATGFTVRLLYHFWQRKLGIPPYIVNILVVLYTAFYPLDVLYVTGDFLGATVRLICFLTVVKGLTFQSNRDALYTVLIGFTQLLAAALLSASLLFFLFLAAFLFSGVTAFCAWEIKRGARGARIATNVPFRGFTRRILTVSGISCLGILVFTVALFFVLPRTARAALQNLISQRFHLPGYGGEVDLRKIGEIQTSSRTIMHVRIADQPEILPFRWRGGSMSQFDGKRWYTRDESAQELRVPNGSIRFPTRWSAGRPGRLLSYEVALTETGVNTLFIAGEPDYLEVNAPWIKLVSNNSIRTLLESPSLLHYKVEAFFDASSGDATPQLTREERRRLLELPRSFDGRISQLAWKVGGSENFPGLQARRLEYYLQTSFGYTLELPDEEHADPIAHFLFERKQGHCEYFASSMALMLRTLGIPSRIVTGFRGGTYNPVSGWYTVKASDAHSWVEAFIPGNGWTTFDPTPATIRGSSVQLLTRFSHLIDAADLFWQEWVMQYDLERQFHLASTIENSRWGTRGRGVAHLYAQWSSVGLRTVGWFMVYGWWIGGGVLAGAAVWMLYPWVQRQRQERTRRDRLRKGEAGAHDATVLYRDMLLLLENNGVRKPAWFTPLEFAANLQDRRVGRNVRDFTEAYNRLRFGADPAAAGELLHLYEQIEKDLAEPAVPAASHRDS